MNLYGEKGDYVYDPLSYASKLIEANLAPDWKDKLDFFLNTCEKVIEKSANQLIPKKDVIKIAINTGFISSEKVVEILKNKQQIKL